MLSLQFRSYYINNDAYSGGGDDTFAAMHLADQANKHVNLN